MTASEKIQAVVAVLLGVFGVVMLAGVAIQSLEGTSQYSLITDLLLAVLFAILPLACGIGLYRRIRNAVARRAKEDNEKVVLQLAKEHHGALTAVEVAANSALTLEQAKETLDQLNLKGFNEMEVSDAGILVYKFRL